MAKHPIPPERFIPYKGTKKFIKSRQCAARVKAGRCMWYAQKDRIYCARHGRREGHTMSQELKDKFQSNVAAWWVRMRELEKTHPGLIRAALNSEQGGRVRKAARVLEKTTMPKPKTDDKMILKAHKALVKDVALLPAVPDKPFEELEPHEKLTVITGQSLAVVHQILTFKIVDKDGVPDLKAASLVKDTAMRALSVRVKIDRNALSERRLDKIGELLERLKADGDGAKDATVIEGSVN